MIRKFELPLLSRAEIFAKTSHFCWIELKNCPYYHKLKFFTKYSSFDDFTWKSELPVLLRGNLFPKIRWFCWYDLKFWTALIIKSWNFLKNLADFMKSIEYSQNLNCRYYHEMKFSQNWGSFVEPIWKFELPLLWQASIFSKIRESLWYHLIIWNAPIITSWNFRKNIPFLMKPFEHLNALLS